MRLSAAILLLLLSGVFKGAVCQKDTISVAGKVTTAESGAIPYRTMIINQRKGIGIFPDGSGRFRMEILRKDSILITAPGYATRRISFADSTGSRFHVNIVLKKLEIELAEHVVMPKRELEDVHEDLKEIELKMPDRPTGMGALSSPVTALYMRFSKMERSKRLVAEMEYRDKKQELLKELFRIYVDADIITLSPDEFDRFIAYCNPSDKFLHTASEYELIRFFKDKFSRYIEHKR